MSKTIGKQTVETFVSVIYGSNEWFEYQRERRGHTEEEVVVKVSQILHIILFWAEIYPKTDTIEH